MKYWGFTHYTLDRQDSSGIRGGRKRNSIWMKVFGWNIWEHRLNLDLWATATWYEVTFRWKFVDKIYNTDEVFGWKFLDRLPNGRRDKMEKNWPLDESYWMKYTTWTTFSDEILRSHRLASRQAGLVSYCDAIRRRRRRGRRRRATAKKTKRKLTLLLFLSAWISNSLEDFGYVDGNN
jgi:hypothetical protein